MVFRLLLLFPTEISSCFEDCLLPLAAISDDEVEESKEATMEGDKEEEPKRKMPTREEIFSALEKIDNEITRNLKRLEKVHAKKRIKEG